MKKYHVYGIGNALVDMEYAVDDDFLHHNDIEKGVMTLVDENRQQQLVSALSELKGKRACGGSAANTIFAVNYFGGSAYYSCKVADDDTGSFFANDIVAAGVDSNVKAERSAGTTGKCLVMVTPDAERTMNTFLGISETVSSNELDEEAIKASDYVYLEGYLVTSDSGRAAVIKAKEIAQANGVKTALTFSDPNMVSIFKSGLEEMVGDGVDLLFCNEEEAKTWADTADLSKAVETLEGIAKSFVITLGSKGALAYDGQTMHTIEPHDVNAIDSNGAGDMFAGAFLYGITHGYDFATAGALASLASAEVVSHFGPRLAPQAHQELLQKIFNN